MVSEGELAITIAGDQCIALVLPRRVFRAEFGNRGMAPHYLTRLAADRATVTSPPVPCNSTGACMGAVFGVPTPFSSMVYGFNIVSHQPASATEGPA
jgi:NhaC family Na+:H+ antiporter